ncbi:Fic family protein [Shiella aurantiaca]|nr:Fic family protein [Shiella aurantiaca]
MKNINPSKPFNDLPLLPPPLEKVEAIQILKQESKAAVALAELKGLARTLPNQGILINAIVLKEAQASSEVENIITTHDKLYQALAAKTITIDPSTKEVLRYREALLYGFEEIKTKGFLNTNGIARIQAILEENEAGIRQLPGTSLKNDLTGETIYTPPDDKDAIIKLMKNLEDFINAEPAEISPLIRMAIQHYQFESIHPFYDGNGRTGRIINVLYLILHNLLEIPMLYLSGYIIGHKGAYYRLLQEVRTKDNWEGWILFMLKAIEDTATKAISQINGINSIFNEIQDKVKSEAPKIYSKDLIEQLFVHPYTKIEYISSGLGVERKAASRYLKTLESIGILKLEPIGKENIFINQQLYHLLKQN